MKLRSNLVLTLIVVCCNICNSQTGWIKQNIPTSDSLRSIKFLNPQTGWAAGTNGVILKTTNAGLNWIIVPSKTTEDLNSIFPISDSVIFVAGDSGIILKTNDGGSNWMRLKDNSDSKLTSIYFINSLTGIVTGFDATILRTTDAGKSWTLRDSPTDINLHSVFFVNENKGWIGGYGGIYSSTSAGLNWSGNFIDGALVTNSIFFSDSLHGWAAYYDNKTFGPENIRTTDGGISWRNYSMNYSYSLSIYFTNSLTGWSSGYYGKINYSTDGGASWSVQSSGSSEHLNSITFTDSLTGWIAGNSGTILKTTTGGVLTGYSGQNSFLPEGYSLKQNFPNPFNPTTTIVYELPVQRYVSLKIYDNLGNRVAVLSEKEETAGIHEETFSGDNLSSGLYFYRIEAGDYYETKKMILLK